MAASLRADESLRAAVAEASANIEAFAKRSLRRDWTMRNSHGATVGEKFDPLLPRRHLHSGRHGPAGFHRADDHSAGPRGRLPRNRRLHAVRPQRADQSRPALCRAAGRGDGDLPHRRRAGHRRPGPGHEQPSATVNKIFGPGNAYVVAAKRLLFGYAAMDLLPGPSELLVLADDTARPAFIAADLLAQAEHGSGHERVWLVTPSLKLLRAVQKEIARQLPKLARRELIERALRNNGWLIQVAGLEQAVELANRLAPEHLEIICRRGADLAEKITTAGAIFLGGDSPDGAGRLCGRPQPHPAGGRDGRFLRRADRGPISAAHQPGRIQQARPEKGAEDRPKIRRTGRPGRARLLRCNKAKG